MILDSELEPKKNVNSYQSTYLNTEAGQTFQSTTDLPYESTVKNYINMGPDDQNALDSQLQKLKKNLSDTHKKQCTIQSEINNDIQESIGLDHLNKD